MRHYSLLKKEFGLSGIETLFKFDFPYEINDFCIAGDHGFAFSSTANHFAFLINHDGEIAPPYYGTVGEQGQYDPSKSSPSFGLLSSPSSLVYLKGRIAVAQEGGRFIGEICIECPMPYVMLSRGADSSHKLAMEAKWGKIKNLDPKCALTFDGKNHTYWSVNVLHSCYQYIACQHKLYIGSGKAGYSNSSEPSRTMLNSPQGLMACNNQLYISDTNNHCIRCYDGKTVRTVAGSPTEKGDRNGCNSLLEYPSKIRGNGRIMYFVDCTNSIKSLDSSTRYVKKILSLDKLISIETNKDGDLYILEEI